MEPRSSKISDVGQSVSGVIAAQGEAPLARSVLLWLTTILLVMLLGVMGTGTYVDLQMLERDQAESQQQREMITKMMQLHREDLEALHTAHRQERDALTGTLREIVNTQCQ